MYYKNELDILSHIQMNGQVEVEFGPHDINQNKNFYHRVHKLEKIGAIIVQRRDGQKSLYTLTNVGLDIIMGRCR